jgi:membrane-bound ClpP family serine protease
MYWSVAELFFWGTVLLIILVLTIKSFFVRVQCGREGLVGKKTSALADFSKKGKVYEGQVLCMGEIWAAKADFPVSKGENFFVYHSEGLVLFLNNEHDENKKENECCT